MASAHRSGSTGRKPLQGEKAFKGKQLPPYSHIKEGENFTSDCEESSSCPRPKTRSQEAVGQQTLDPGDYHPGKEPSKKKRKQLRWADYEPKTSPRERKQAFTHSQLNSQIDQSLVTTMAFEDFNTQATQPYTDPRRLGLHGSGISEDDAVNVICILHPSSPAAHDAVAATTEQNPHHIIPNADLTTEDEESLFDPAARLDHSSREIALRISSQTKNPEIGFTFGRNPDRCDVLLTKDRSDVTVSNRHFRIYMTKDGILMLQDTSTNGTLVDEEHLRCKQDKETDCSSHMLQNGMIICILGNGRREIKFLVRMPNRGDYLNAYNANLARYVAGLPGAKSRLVLSGAELSYGMNWNGGSVYNVVGCLGKGAFATVYKLATKKDGQLFAAKELDKRKFLKHGITDMKFDNEIQIMKDLRHPNIVQYEDYHEHDDWAYIIMEMVPGGELSTYMHKQGPLPEPMVQTVTQQILHALAYLHARGITHRDIKPDNILVSETDPLCVKLSDFGLSKCITNQETFLKTFCGTLLYCAPEIYPGYSDYDKSETKKRRRLGAPSPKRYSERVDMWSFGAVLFHILCNKPPVIIDGENKAALMLTKIMTTDIDFGPLHAHDVSEEAIDFVSNLLKRNPVLRPTPKACFQHAWLAEVADAVDYMNLDDEMPAYRGQGLSTVEEADEDFYTRADDAEYDHIFGPGGGLSFGYLNTAGERISKRQRIAPKARGKAIPPQSGDVAYPQLPQAPCLMGPPATNIRDERLFGEITSSLLKSSGVFAGAPPAVGAPVPHAGDEQISFNDFAKLDNGAPPSSRELPGPPLQYPRTLGIAGVVPSSDPSLRGAEAQIGQLQMVSPEAGHSEATTPDTGDPSTPETRELTPATRPPSGSDDVKSGGGAVDETSEEPIFSRYIDIGVPVTLAHDTNFVNEFNARDAEAKQRRARKAAKRERQAQKAKGLSGAERTKGDTQLTQPTRGRSDGKIFYSTSGTQTSDQQISRKIDLPPLESLYPTSTTTADGFTKPLRRFGKLTSIPGSYTDVTIYINSRMTSWGRGPSCNVKYDDLKDTRIPLYAIQITYHAPGMEGRIERGLPWETAPGIHTVVSTAASKWIYVNDVELRKESSEERCAYYGKIYTGDIITVYQSSEPQGPFLKLRVEMNYGDSARRRPESEQGFQVLRERVFYEAEMQRRERMKSNGQETSASASPSKAV